MLYVCCGLPRCGKSSFADVWVNCRHKRVIVAGDDIRLALTGQRYLHCAEEVVHTTKHLMIKSLLIRGHHVLHDGTNTTLESIHKMEEIAKITGNRLIFVLFNTNKKECIYRAENSNQYDLVPVIEEMSNNLPQTHRYIQDNYENREDIAIINASELNQKNYYIGHNLTNSTYDTITTFGDVSCQHDYNTNVIRINNDNSIYSV